MHVFNIGRKKNRGLENSNAHRTRTIGERIKMSQDLSRQHAVLGQVADACENLRDKVKPILVLAGKTDACDEFDEKIADCRFEAAVDYDYDDKTFEDIQITINPTQLTKLFHIIELFRSHQYGVASTLTKKEIDAVMIDKQNALVHDFKEIRCHYDFQNWDKTVFSYTMGCYHGLMHSRKPYSNAKKELYRAAKLVDEKVVSYSQAIDRLVNDENADHHRISKAVEVWQKSIVEAIATFDSAKQNYDEMMTLFDKFAKQQHQLAMLERDARAAAASKARKNRK